MVQSTQLGGRVVSQEPGTASQVGFKSRPQHPMRRGSYAQVRAGLAARMLTVQNTAGEFFERFRNSREA